MPLLCHNYGIIMLGWSHTLHCKGVVLFMVRVVGRLFIQAVNQQCVYGLYALPNR